jgi:tRNA 2-thiouridine synthesizing protein E
MEFPMPTGTSEVKLTHQLIADPDDTDAYLVYADLLQQQDDPRGEFILLCHRADDDDGERWWRARSDYLENWRGELLADLDDALASGAIECRWHLGFFGSVKITPGPDASAILGRLARNPSAQFLTRLDLSHTAVTELPATLAGLAALRELDVSKSSVTRIPEAMADLGLEQIRAQGCRIEQAPISMASLLLASGARSLPDSYSTLYDFERDEEDYLVDLSEWTPAISSALAALDGLVLTPDHWAIIEFLREYYDDYQIMPADRVLIKAVKKLLGADKGNRDHLAELFPDGLARQAAKVAGLPKPTC